MKINTEPMVNFSLPDGCNLRGFYGEQDYIRMAALINATKEVDGLERSINSDDIAHSYTHLYHCDLSSDILFVESDEYLVAYTRVWWNLAGDGQFVGFSTGYVHPDWRCKGIGTALLLFDERRLKQIASQLHFSGELPQSASAFYDHFISSKEIAKEQLLLKNGYQVVRYAFEMLRPDLENLPEAPMPDGLEIRPVLPEHYRRIWEASNEAFRDHWGYIPDPWEEYESMISAPDHDPSLWRVAWEGDQIAGMVLSFIVHKENTEYHRLRGYTENICVRRPWRKRGLARSLIVQSLQALKELGMTEAALGVDAENTSGALNLYKYCGYQVVKRNTIYRKPFQVDG